MHKMKVIFLVGYMLLTVFFFFRFGHWIISLANVGGWKH